MDANRRAALRLVDAVEVLMAQEAVMVAAGRRKGVVEIMKRSAPLFRHLATLGVVATDAGLRARFAKIAETRRQTRQFLTAQLNQVAEELVRVRAAQQRLRRIVPAYASAYGRRRVSSRLTAFS